MRRDSVRTKLGDLCLKGESLDWIGHFFDVHRALVCQVIEHWAHTSDERCPLQGS